MILAGKCPPEPEELTAAADRGFDAVELYLTAEHLESLGATLSALRDAEVDVVSVHTPHIVPTQGRLLVASDELAHRLDAYLVVHSQYAGLFEIPRFEAHDLNANRGYENPVGASRYHLERAILDPGHELVLDTAHLFTGEEDYLEEFAYLLERYTDRVSVVHLCDSTPLEDGLPVGHGDIDMDGTACLLRASFDGVLVLEVMPDHQRDALEWFGAQ